MTGTIYNIQRFSIHDGPGIRTTVFFKGCNLRCLWCHNPESISRRPEVEFYPERCIGCGRCFDACPTHAHILDETGAHRIDRSLCEGCLACAGVCYAEALVGVGREVSVEELLASILTDRPYYEQSGGGVTFSGGECMAQVDFLSQILAACRREGIHTAVDTAGNVPWESFGRVLEHTELFLYDLKAADSETHRRLTGAGNERIISNLKNLCAAGKRVIVRIPYIPGCNDAEMEAMAGILEGLHIASPASCGLARQVAPGDAGLCAIQAHGLPVERVEVMPYHRLGEGKYASLGIEAKTAIATPTPQETEAAVELLRRHGINAHLA